MSISNPTIPNGRLNYKRGKLTVVHSLRLNAEDVSLLEDEIARTGETMSEAVRRAIRTLFTKKAN